MKKIFFIAIIFSISTILNAQPFTEHPVNSLSKPKLIVGIVVDQMRYDYITRYWNKYGKDGFKKLTSQGFNCTNTHYNYIPTYTGPGHASIFTGTTPSVHGIISNDWYDRKRAKNIYVTEDQNVRGVGIDSMKSRMSPANMISTTFNDELRIASNLKSKIIGISLKDRSSILAAGPSANAAYWYDGSTGNFITSTWYMKELPAWVKEFNDKKLPLKYLQTPWTTLLPIQNYTESTIDDSPYEEAFAGETNPVFPHDFSKISPPNFELVRRTPSGSTLLKELALSAIKSEQMGKDEFTDVLTLSFSSTDYIGHQFGTHAIETQDSYLRLDQDLADLITQAETMCGKENVLFFLTADHAAIPNVKFLYDQKIKAGIFNVSQVTDSLNKFLSDAYGNEKWVLTLDNDQVYFDHALISKQKLNLNDVADAAASFLMRFNEIAGILTAKNLYENEYTVGINSMIQKGFYRQRSGDLVLILKPGYIEYSLKGTTHGAGYTYDTHVPLIFYGWKIKKGLTARHVNITDIAPTISQILGIQPPNGSTGLVIEEVLK